MSYIIQTYCPEDGLWIDCEDGRFNHTPAKLKLASERIRMWGESVPDVDLRLIERTEKTLIEIYQEDDEDGYLE